MDEGGHETWDGKTDHLEQEEENDCGHEQCGQGTTGDEKQHQTEGESKREGGQKENGTNKDRGAGLAKEQQRQQQEQKTVEGK